MTAKRLRIWRGILACLAGASAALSHAQENNLSAAPVVLAGVPTADIISLHAYTGGVPLRFGNVIQGTERVQLNGRLLVSGDDYALDYSAGVIYLKTAVKLGDSLVVTYRYDSKAAAAASTGNQSVGGISGLDYSLVPGSFSMIMGLGMADRAADGTVLSSNVYGLRNTLSFGQGSSLGGTYILAHRQRADNISGLSMETNAKPGDSLNAAGGSQFLVQSLRSKLMGGSVSFDYQSISKHFASFSGVKTAGYSDADVTKFQTERGLARQNLAAEFGQKSGKLSFFSQGISDSNSRDKISRNGLTFDSTKYKFDFGDERVGSSFARLTSLTKDEQGQWSREVGVERKWFNFNVALSSKDKPITIAEQDFKSSSGKYSQLDAAYTGKTWSIEHFNLGSTTGYTNMAALPDAQVTQNLQKVADMYGPKITPSAADKSSFVGGVGIQRDFTTLGGTFFKGYAASFSHEGLKGATDHGAVDAFSITGGKLAATFRQQTLGTNFAEVSSLMPLEQARLGTLAGISKRDYSFSDQFTATSKLAISGMDAKSSTGAAGRMALDFTGKGLEIAGTSREVGTNFATAGQLVDPEAATLASIQGFRQREFKFNWNTIPTIKFTGLAQDAKDEATGETRGVENSSFNWNVDKNTLIGFVDNSSSDKMPLQTLFMTEVRQLSLSHSLGRFGKVSFLDEQDVNDGINSTVPSSHKDYFSYEAALTKTTSWKAEQTLTHFADGTHEQMTADTISTALSKRAGVSLTEVQVSGNSTTQDQTKNNYGLWYDLGNGVRVSYGYNHQLNQTTDTATNNLTVGKNPNQVNPDQYSTLQAGALGGWNMAGGYGTNQYFVPGQTHTQSFSNVALSNATPLQFGPVQNIKFNLGMDTASDYSTWSKNNHAVGLSGQYGKDTFGFDYKGQLAATGSQGVDRAYRFQTDPSDLRWLKATVLYKVRTIPGVGDYTIRDYNIAARIAKNLSASNQLQTNPEIANTGAFLGSVPQAARSDKWSVDYAQGPSTSTGLSYQELINEANSQRATTGGVNFKFFQKTSPLTLFFGQEDQEGNNQPHRLTSRYSLQFDQRPGPNQTLSMFLGNVSYDYNHPDGVGRENWTMRMDWQIRF